MSTVHELKTWPRHFEAMWLGEKQFEFRYNDRNYKVGDIVYLGEWIPDLNYNETKLGIYTGRYLYGTITYILDASEEQPEFVPDNWVILSLVIWKHGISVE